MDRLGEQKGVHDLNVSFCIIMTIIVINWLTKR
jgi:hypothetical protein